MSNRRNDLLDLHPASIVGSALGGRPSEGPAAQDAEPEAYVPRQGILRRALSAFRARREAAARAETNRA